ncbi:hypothetical protein BHM03_00039425 [Ensete ventricosum]|nr:hypothetical protein BHM03_00039425 [Ensete ventricosum]
MIASSGLRGTRDRTQAPLLEVEKEHVAEKKTSLVAVTSPVISEPVLVNTNSSGLSLENRTSSTSNTGAVTFPLSQSVQNQVIVGSHASSDTTQVLEECAATKIQAAFRGFLIHYDPAEPNSVFSWLERWTSSHFWKPLPQPKKPLNVKSRVRCSSAVESESVRLKPNVHRNVPAKVDVMTESERYKRHTRKMPSPPPDSMSENPQSEIEKVKRSLRKVSSSTKEASEKPESENQKPACTLRKVATSLSDAPEQSIEESSMKIKNESVAPLDCNCEGDATINLVALDGPMNPEIVDSTAIKLHISEDVCKEENISICNEELSSKDNQSSNEIQKSSKRRASFPSKPEPLSEDALQNAPKLPSYMATTESAKAKLRGQVSPSCFLNTVCGKWEQKKYEMSFLIP